MYRILDWKRQWFQCVALILSIVHPLFFDLPKVIVGLLTQVEVKVSELEIIWRLLILYRKWTLAAGIFIFLIFKFRKHNKDIVIRQNISNRIIWHTIWGYWLCRKVLNYQKISLVRVPIPMQFRLICSNLFEEYQYDSVVELESGKDCVKKEVFNDACYTNTVNLVLADTYPLSWTDQLPADYLNFTTIKIDRTSEDRRRYCSADFIKEVVFAVRDLPQNVVEINLFGTLNPAHCLGIAKECFMTGGRDHIKMLNVFQQSSEGTRVFIDKKERIFV